MELKITNVPIDAVKPNPWNPNKQTDRQYEAEIESILSNGFVMPIIVRKVGDTYQIIDGEHRWRALKDIIDNKKAGAGNIATLTSNKIIPTIVLDVTDSYAKRLTIILNETRGRADFTMLGSLLAELAEDFNDDLITGLPYTTAQLNELISINDFDWSSLDVDTNDDALGSHEPQAFRIVVVLDADGEALWKNVVEARKESLPTDRKDVAGALIKQLLMEAGK